MTTAFQCSISEQRVAVEVSMRANERKCVWLRSSIGASESKGCMRDSLLIPDRVIIYNLKLIMSESIITELKNIKAGDKNMHQHIKQFVSTLLLDRGNLQAFESYSAQQRIAGGTNECVFKVREAYSHLKDYEVKHRALLAKLNSGGAEGEVQEPASIGFVPDLQEESRVFEQFGCGFGEEETYRIFKSLSRFSLKKNAKYLNLWGKIIGSQKDYYIAEGQADGEEAGELSPETEPKGTGANKWTFYACTDLTGEWTELPVITPAQLKISRKIKYIFTGDLGQTVLTNPLFPGKQSHLLKCQLVRIQTACTLVPRGSLVINAESNEIETPEEFQYPDIAVLNQKESWIYQNPSLLKNGRTTLLKPEGMEPEDEEKWVKAQNKLDPSEPRLKNIVLDSEKWSVKGVAIEEVYKTIGKNSKGVSKGVVGIKNLVWPGWLTVAYGTKTSSLYVGYGHKYRQNYYPFDPETVLQEAPDREEFVVVVE